MCTKLNVTGAPSLDFFLAVTQSFIGSPMTSPLWAASDDEHKRSSDQIFRVVAYFSILAADRTINEKSEGESSRIGSEDAVSEDTDKLVQVVQVVLNNRAQALYDELRQKRLREDRPCQGNAVTGADKACESASDFAGESGRQLDFGEVPNHASQIDMKARGIVFVDMTSISVLSALVPPESSELNGDDPWQQQVLLWNTSRHAEYEANSRICEPLCPLQALAASKAEWWNRPLWAWTWKEMILAHGVMLTQDILNVLAGDTKWYVVVSTDRCLAQLPSFHLKCGSVCSKGTQLPILIDPVVDASVVRRIVNEDTACSVCDTLPSDELARVRQQLLECYGRKEETPVNKDSRDEIESLLQAIEGNARHVRSPDAEENDEPIVALTPEHAKRMHEVKQGSTATEVTPEAERCIPVPPVENNGDIRESEVALVSGNTEGDAKKTEVQDSSLKRAPECYGSLPQIDSSGIDIAMLSQLPASVRSEARIAAALRDNLPFTKLRSKPKVHGSLHTWFSSVGIQGKDGEIHATCVSGGKKKTAWLSVGDVDPDTLKELPQHIQIMIQSELSQGIRRNRKRSGIASFFQSTTKRYK